MVHRDVGVLENRYAVQAVLWIDANSNAQTDRESMATDEMRLGHCPNQLLGDEYGVLRLHDFGKKHYKFVAAVAADRIRTAHAGLQSRRSGLQ